MLAFMLTLLKFVFNINLVLTDCISSTVRASPGKFSGEHNTSICSVDIPMFSFFRH